MYLTSNILFIYLGQISWKLIPFQGHINTSKIVNSWWDRVSDILCSEVLLTHDGRGGGKWSKIREKTCLQAVGRLATCAEATADEGVFLP